MEKFFNIQEELKTALQNSVVLSAVIENTNANLQKGTARPQARSRVMKKVQQVYALQELLNGKKEKQQRTPEKFPEEVLEQKASERFSAYKRKLGKHMGKRQLYYTVQEMNHMVTQTAAGKLTTGRHLTSDAQIPPAIRHFRLQGQTQSDKRAQMRPKRVGAKNDTAPQTVAQTFGHLVTKALLSPTRDKEAAAIPQKAKTQHPRRPSAKPPQTNDRKRAKDKLNKTAPEKVPLVKTHYLSPSREFGTQDASDPSKQRQQVFTQAATAMNFSSPLEKRVNNQTPNDLRNTQRTYDASQSPEQRPKTSAGKTPISTMAFHSQRKPTTAPRPHTSGRMSATSTYRGISPYSPLETQTFDATRATSAVPHVSMTSGKIEDPLKLPTFDEYCDAKDIEISEGPSTEKTIRKIYNAKRILQDFETELEGLITYLEANPKVPWNGDKNVLKLLNEHPNKKRDILKKYNESFLRSMNAKRRFTALKRQSLRHKFPRREGIIPTVLLDGTSLAEVADPAQYEATEEDLIAEQMPQVPIFEEELTLVLDPSGVLNCDIEEDQMRTFSSNLKTMNDRTNDFIKLQDDQNVRLADIITRLNIERPVNVKKKINLIGKDTGQFRNTGHSLDKFSEFKRSVEKDRRFRRQENKRQAIIYDEMLEFLKNRDKTPTEQEKLFLQVIKSILEEGWAIAEKEFYLVLEQFDLQEMVNTECVDLVNVVGKMIGVERLDLYKW